MKESLRIIYALGVTALMNCVMGCNSNIVNDKICDKYKVREYSIKSVDKTLLREVYESYEFYLDKFNEKTLRGSDFDAYHLQYSSSHGFGKSIKFEKRINAYTIDVKCIVDTEWNKNCKEYQINIAQEDWNELEKIIYEFDFWSSENFRHRDALDGDGYFLEGNRPGAEECNLLTNKLVGRGSQRYDKIGALCKIIIEYESDLRFKYDRLIE